MQQTKWRLLPRKSIVRILGNSMTTHFLTAVTAPAGYGKTTVAQALVGRGDKRRFYHSVPAGLTSADRWWESLCDALAKQGLEEAPALRRIGMPQNDSTRRRAVALFEEITPAFSLILDDFHHFTDAGVCAFLEMLARAQAGGHRLAVFSRVKPQMDFDELERLGLAGCFDQTLLEFSETDAVRFFFLNGVADGKTARAAWRYSEGWVAALWLCLQTRQTERTATPRAVAQRSKQETPLTGSVDKLLDRAVFAAYSRDDREFLMRLSVLDAFTADEAEAVALRADAPERLREMADGNAFIRYVRGDDMYVMHSIFRDFLGKRLAVRPDLNTPELYRRAAERLILRGDTDSAYRMLMRAGRDEDLLRMLDAIVARGRQRIFNAKRGELLPLLEKIPWRLKLKQPMGYLLFIWLCFDDALDGAEGIALFEEAADRFARAKGMPAHLKYRIEGELEFMRGWIYTDHEPELLLPRYRHAYALLRGPSIFPYERRCWNCGAPHALFVYLPRGVLFREIIDLFGDACAPISLLTGGVIEGCERVAGIEYRLERGEFAEAARQVDELDALLDFPRNLSSLIMARFSRARLLSLTGDADAAAIMKDMLRRVEATDSTEPIQCAELALAYILANDGRPAEAPRWLRDGDIFERPFGATRILCFMAAVYGKLLLAQNDADGLKRFLSNHPDILTAAGTVFADIHAAVFKAILAWRDGDADAALAHMRDAVEHSRPDGYILPVAEYGSHVLPIIRALARKMPDDDHVRKTAALTEQLDAARRRREDRAKRRLTAKEATVMQLVVKGRSTAAIAKKMGTSESAVKNALSICYKKLGAKNRAEAARRFQPAPTRPTRSRQAPPPVPDEAPDAATEEMRDAFRALLRAGGDEDLAQALELFARPGGDRMLAFHYEELCAAVQLLSWDVRLRRPMGYLAFLWRYFRVFDEGMLGLDLDEADYRLRRMKTLPAAERKRLAGEAALIRSMLRADDPEEFWSNHRTACKLLEGPSQFYTAQTSWTLGNPQLTFGLVRKPGDFEALAGRTAEAAKTLSALSGGRFASLDTAFHMERHLERGEMEEARALLPKLERAGADDMQTGILAAFAGARLLLSEGRGAEALEMIERLTPRVKTLESFELSESLDLATGYVAAHCGAIDRVAGWIREGRTGAPPHGATARCPFASVTYAKTLLATGDFARLAPTARVMPARFGEFASLPGRIHAMTLEAIAAKYHRREDEALTLLGEALELSRADGLVFAIAEYGGWVLPLLRRIRRMRPDDEHVKRTAILADRISRRRERGGKTVVRNRRILTLREREIMRYVTQGQSNQRIAGQLGVSDSRINKALTDIYRKLHASNRAEASRRFAEEYGS